MSGGTPNTVPVLEILAVHGLGEIRAGDDLGHLLATTLAERGPAPRDGDVLVVSSKVVSKAAGLVRHARSREEAVASETLRVVAERRVPSGTSRIVVSRAGPVLAAAGVDNSNVVPGQVLTLPPDPDGAARALRRRLTELTGLRLAVIVSDTAGRPWREGQVDFALGAAGLHVTEDLRGTRDGYGNPLDVTVRAVADELAAVADLVKGKTRGVPAAVVRGLAGIVLPPGQDGPGAAALLRPASQDWFRTGHVEAVRSALGVPPGTPGLEIPPVAPGDAGERLERAVRLALVAPTPWDPSPTPWDPSPAPWDPSPALLPVVLEARTVTTGGTLTLGVRAAPTATVRDDGSATATASDGDSPDPRRGAPPAGDGIPEAAWSDELLVLGALAQRVTAAAWSEGLHVTVRVLPGPPPRLEVRARDAGQSPDAADHGPRA